MGTICDPAPPPPSIGRYVVVISGHFLESVPISATQPTMPTMTQPLPEKRARREMGLAEFERIAAACGSGKTARRDRALIAFLALTGARVSEALAVRACDLTRPAGGEDGEVRLPGTKTDGANGFVGLPPRLWDELERWLPLREKLLGSKARTLPLFPALREGSIGNPLDRKKVADMLKRRAQAAGIEGRVHPHAFRHGYLAALWRASGGDMVAVQRGARHKNLVTTQVYLSEREGFVRAKAAAHEAFPSEAPPESAQEPSDAPDESEDLEAKVARLEALVGRLLEERASVSDEAHGVVRKTR